MTCPDLYGQHAVDLRFEHRSYDLSDPSQELWQNFHMVPNITAQAMPHKNFFFQKNKKLSYVHGNYLSSYWLDVVIYILKVLPILYLLYSYCFRNLGSISMFYELPI